MNVVMKMIGKWQAYISDSLDPYTNLATETWLSGNTPSGCCTLYLWRNDNTVVIGRNQNPWAECRCELLEREGGHLARRQSGGGAVYHDSGNLNFTFLCDEEDMDIARNMRVIAAACRLAGIDVTVSGRNDILAGGRKFSGNAFYHAGGRAYHHGTLLIRTDTERMRRYLTPSKAKLEAKGVKSVRGRVINLVELAPDLTGDRMTDYMLTAAEEVFGMPPTPFGTVDADAIAHLAAKYGSWEYLYGAQPPFTAACEGQFAWGHAELRLLVARGVLEDVQMYTDALDWTLPEQVRNALVGCRFHEAGMCEAFFAALPRELAAGICTVWQEVR